MERTLIILKPDAVQRGLVGEIITRFEKKGLQIVGMKLMKIPQADWPRRTTSRTRASRSTPASCAFMTSSPVVVLALAGKDAIAIARKMMGATFGSKAEPGTIRGDFGVSNSFNLIHGSDSPESRPARTGLVLQARRTARLDADDAVVGVRHEQGPAGMIPLGAQLSRCAGAFTFQRGP